MTEPTMDNKIIFQQDSPNGMEEVLRLDKKGFHYKDQFIADAGEAYRLMVEFLKPASQPKESLMMKLSPTTQKVWNAFKTNGICAEEKLAVALETITKQLESHIDLPNVDGSKYAGIWHCIDYLSDIANELKDNDEMP
jgi:hypothetical protein